MKVIQLCCQLFIRLFEYGNHLSTLGMSTVLIIQICMTAAAPVNQDAEAGSKDWVFINYTFKRFEGLTQRGCTPIKK